MNEIQRALKKLSFRKQMYVKYKFNMWFRNDTPHVTEESFLKKVDLKTMDTFIRWEKSAEFKNIATLILASKSANDLIEIYDKVKAKVSGDNPDYKAIETMLKLMREIDQHAKEARVYFSDNQDEEEEDGLEL